MKKTILVALWSISGMLTAQTSGYNRWSLELSGGGCKAINPYTSGYSSNTIGFPSLEFGGRYMFNSYGGVRMEVAYNRIRFDHFGDASSDPFNTEYTRLTAEAVMNIGQILDFYEIHPRLGLLTYLGMGASVMFNQAYPFGKKDGSDEMIHLSFGFSPQFRLNDRLTLSGNFRGLAHIYQSMAFDMKSWVLDRGIDGFMLSGTIGVQYYLGKHRTHIDWYDGARHLKEALKNGNERYNTLLAEMKDSDQDGVPDYLDQEPDTKPGAEVTVKGITVGNPESPIVTETAESIDGFVEFPDKKELFFSVQVGYFSNPLDLASLYGLKPLFSAKTQTGDTRYLYGSYGKLQEALQMRAIAFESGVKDAFVVAYFQGKRITIAQAEKLLMAHGNSILMPAG